MTARRSVLPRQPLRCLLPAALALLLLIVSKESAQAIDLLERDPLGLTLTGSYTNLFSLGEDTAGKDFTSDYNRLRTIWRATYGDSLELDITYQHEAFFGSILDSGEFAFTRGERDTTYFDWEHTIADHGDAFWSHSLYRAYLIMRAPNANLTVGRQRISWGTGLFWNPTDSFNPISPLQVEPEEKVGADAVNLEIPLDWLTLLNFVYARSKKFELPTPAELLARGVPPDVIAHLAADPPDFALIESFLEEEDVSSAAGRFRTTVGTYDVSFIGGQFDHDEFVGGNFSGYVKDAGLRGEFTYTFAQDRPDHYRFVLGADYSFSNTLYLVAEYFYNGQAARFDREELFEAQLRGELTTLNPHQLGLGATYDLTPLVKLQAYGIWDIEGEGLFVNPEIYYSARADLDIRAGVQLFTGEDGSDFDGVGNIYYVKVEWFF
jgi:hypothetical protein